MAKTKKAQEQEIEYITEEELHKNEVPDADGWIHVGTIGVDAGLCWVGDPCYVLPRKSDKEKGFDYDDLLDKHLFAGHRKVLNTKEYEKNKKLLANPGADYGDWDEDFIKHASSYPENRDHMSIPFELGHEGMGVVVQTGHGDGSYPVYIKRKNGIVAEVKVVFISDEDEDYADDEDE